MTTPAKKKPNKQHAVKGSSLSKAASALRLALKQTPPETPYEAVHLVCVALEGEGKRVRSLR